MATGYNGTGVDEDLLEGKPLLFATSRDHSITGPHPCTSPLGLNPQLRQHKLAVLKPTEPTNIPMALHAPRSSPVSSTHGCIWHCTYPSEYCKPAPPLPTRARDQAPQRARCARVTSPRDSPRSCSSPVFLPDFNLLMRTRPNGDCEYIGT
jgi:hypothetical protein